MQCICTEKGPFLFEQGGNDHEIYESEQTVGHTGYF